MKGAGNRAGESRRWFLPVPTARLVAVAAAPLALSLAAIAIPRLASAALLADAIIALAASLDLILALGCRNLVAEARQPRTFSAGKEGVLAFAAINRGHRQIQARLLPDLPQGFEGGEKPAEATLAPEDTAEMEFAITPLLRRPCRSRGLHVRIRGSLGLLVLQFFLPAPAEMRVFPDLAEGARYRGLLRAGRTWRAGIRTSRRIGEGTELEALREYRPGEDAKRIDWKATTRLRKTVAREYRADSGSHVAIALDSGRLMAAATDGRSVFDRALASIVVLSESVFAGGDSLRVLSFADTIRRELPEQRTRRSLPLIASFLSSLSTAPVEADYLLAASRLLERLTKRSLVVFLTDAAETMRLRSLEKAVAALARTHSVVVVFFRDEEAEALAAACAPDVASAFRKAAAAEIVMARDALALRLSRRAAVAFVRPGELTASLLEAYADAKAKRRF